MAVPELFLVAGGVIFFPLLFNFILYIQRQHFGDKHADAVIYTVALRNFRWIQNGRSPLCHVVIPTIIVFVLSVSTIQALMACTVGLIIIYSCSNDVLYDRHWLTTPYVLFGFPYFYYDAWAMYLVYRKKHEAQLTNLSTKEAVGVFMRSQPLMMVHHLLLPVFYLPIIMYFRRGIGDFFIGCFNVIELAVPCISLRAVLLQLGRQKSLLYYVNGVVLITTFATCRVLIFPFMYHCYGFQKGLNIIQVIQSIPVKCNLGCLLLLLLQLYWLWKMGIVFVRTISKIQNRSKAD